MSPSLLFEKAKKLGFKMVAITEHNSLSNALAYSKIADKFGIHYIFGVEIQVDLEIHVLAYFPDWSAAKLFNSELYEVLPNIKNNYGLFGDQVLIDENEMVIGFEDKLLLNSLSWDLQTAYNKVKKYGGLFVAAHVDAESYSIKSQLGFLPDEIMFDGLEVVGDICDWNNNNLPIVKNSDAHYLKDFGCRYTEYEMSDLSFESLKKSLLGRKFKIKSN